MKVSQIRKGIFLVELPTKHLLASTFVRIQEYYECPMERFRGHYFTLEEFMDAYAKEYGQFDYFLEWDGFNVPGDVVREFFHRFRDLSQKETHLHEAVIPIIEQCRQLGGDFYLVGTVTCDLEMLQHEAAHAFYYLDPEYKAAMDRTTRIWAHAEEFKKILLDDGYCIAMVPDETQAYMATSDREYLVNELRFEHQPHNGYRQIFEKKWKIGAN